jgi:excisionase family DNA binding protein
MEKMYKLREACEILRVSKKTIHRWEKAGKIKCVRTPGNHRLVPESEILRILGMQTPKYVEKSDIKPKIEKKEPSGEKVERKGASSREEILDALRPPTMVHRSAFSDLLTVALALRRFSLLDLASRARCPRSVAEMFCASMVKEGFLRQVDQERYELSVEVRS